MSKSKKTAGLLDTLEASLKNLLSEMDKKENAEKYSLTDKMKVFDRVLKLEALKQGIGDGDDGKGFNDDD